MRTKRHGIFQVIFCQKRDTEDDFFGGIKSKKTSNWLENAKHEQPCHLYILNFPPFFLVRGVLLVKLGDILRIFATLLRMISCRWLPCLDLVFPAKHGNDWTIKLSNRTHAKKIVHKCWIFHCHGSCQRVNQCIYIDVYKCIYTYTPFMIDAIPTTQTNESTLEVKERSAWQRFLERRYSYPSDDLKAQVQPEVPRWRWWR